MPSVLFVCTGNQFRSPVAAEAFRQQLERDGRAAGWIVSSAGTWTIPGQPPFRETVEWARSVGLNLEGHVTRLVDAPMLEQADLVLVMETGHKEALNVEFPFARKKVHLLSQVLTGRSFDIPDPALAPEEIELILQNLVDLVCEKKDALYSFAESSR